MVFSASFPTSHLQTQPHTVLTATSSLPSTPASSQCSGLVFHYHWLCHNLIPHTEGSSTSWRFCLPASQEHDHSVCSPSQVSTIDVGEKLLCLSKEGRTWETRIKILDRKEPTIWQHTLLIRLWRNTLTCCREECKTIPVENNLSMSSKNYMPA